MDGLDECEGDEEDPAKMVATLGSLPSVQLLAAGRYHYKFEKHLHPQGILAMHEVNWVDIAKYAMETFYEDEDARSIIRKNSTEAASLV